jgi:serine/threonine protein kinase
MIGSVLDKYEVLQKLGEGATATVYRGRHLTIGRDVAIKVLHPHLSASSRYRERFNREARAVGRLSHQNIVSILDYSGQGTDDCYIVTELVDGMTLLALLQERGRLPSEIAAMVGADLAAALGFAHTAGIIHRDIKPENVMIRRDGRIKLMDFGVARVLDESSITLDGSLLGSPAYMSPQQALDETLDGRSDLFSLGTVLFHSVTGHVPFSGTNASVILRNIIEGNRPDVLELAPQTSPAVAAVIERLLQPRPDDRYPNAEAVQTALLAALEEVHIGPDHPTINLRAYVVDPDACELALATSLKTTLLDVGKERLTQGDTLGALQLFNRLLAIDEENPEVITLIQSLHQAPAAPRRRAPVWLSLTAVLALLVSVGVWWGTRAPVVAEAPVAEVPRMAPAVTSPPPPVVASTTAPSTPAPNVAPPVEPRSAEPALATRGADGQRTPVRLPIEPRSPAAQESARLVIKLTQPGPDVDVWVDGRRHGARKDFNKTSTWVGTSSNPLELSPGKHLIQLKGPYIEDWEQDVLLAPGEVQELPPVLSKKKANFVVNQAVTNECTFTVGAEHYELPAHRTFSLRDPSPGTPVVFTCPSGTITTTLGVVEPGGERVIPTRVDP